MKNTLNTIVILIAGLRLLAQAPTYDLPDFRCSEIKNETIFESGYESEYLLAINDSTLLALPSKNEFFLSKEDLRNEFISDFGHIYYTDYGTFLVHSGGGVVLLYDGRSLTRVDDSFYHQNQYGGKSFEYNNELYLFAGHGLFTAKNILTKYDYNLKEWMLVPQSGKIPEFHPKSISARIGDKLFLLTFQSSIHSKSSNLPLLVYSMDLREMKWELLGQVSLEFLKEIGDEFKKIFFDPTSNKLLIHTNKSRIIVDFIENNYSIIKAKYPLERAILLNHNNGQDFIAFYCDNKTQLEHQIISKKDYYALAQSPKLLFEYNLDVYYSVIFKFFISGLILFALFILLRELKIDNRIVLRLRNRSFIYKLKRLKIYDQLEVNFLVHLAEFDQMTFQELEDRISNKNDSMVTRAKNRDKFIRTLLSKSMAVFNLEPSQEPDILIICTFENDKRLKYYTLNPRYFKIM